jgi:hypothetical protein
MNKSINNKGMQRINLFIDPELVKRAKIYGIKNRISVSKIIQNLIEDYLLSEERKVQI